MILTLVRGLPGAGKSTYAAKLGVLVLEADMFFMRNGKYVFNAPDVKLAHTWCQKATKTALDQGMDVAVANTFTQTWEIAPYVALAARYKAKIRVVHCTGKFKNVHEVPQSKIVDMRNRWEDFPREEEV